MTQGRAWRLWRAGRAWLLLMAALGGHASPARATPLEFFNHASIAAGQPDTILVQYKYGGSGVIVSRDGGKTFAFVCNSYADASLRTTTTPQVTNAALTGLSGGGAVMFLGFQGLWAGADKGCGYKAAAELQGRFVTALASDPLSPKRTYVTTGSGGDAPSNGIFVSESAGASWQPLGVQGSSWIQTIHVVKKDAGRRFWTTKVTPPPAASDAQMVQSAEEDVRYVAQFSDDEGATWTGHEFSPLNQFGPETPTVVFAIVAIDPKNPDALFGIVSRPNADEPDDLVYSPSRGEPGSWKKLASVMTFGGIAIAPDGKIYFGDEAQDTPGLFVLNTPDEEPRALSKELAIGCLLWDQDKDRLLACNRWRFGAVGLTDAKFEVLYDARCGSKFEDCPGIVSSCKSQLAESLNWCAPDHYPQSELCSSYRTPVVEDWIAKVHDYDCVDGTVTPRTAAAGPAGAGGAPASAVSGGAGGRVSAGRGGVSGSGGVGSAAEGGRQATQPEPDDDDDGCSVGAGHPAGSGLGTGLMVLCVLWRRTRRRVAELGPSRCL